MSDTLENTTGLEIAIIGMNGRFPGADNIDALWQNLCAGKEAIRPLSEEELQQSGVPAAIRQHPAYVQVGAPLTDADKFDAAFFGFSPREAEILDPQQRLFLECAWSALEHAGYDSEQYQGAIGVFGAAAMNTYLMNLYSNTDITQTVSPYELFVANDKDFLSTRTGYKINLTGPCVTVQTACSSSLVAVHMACQSLIAGECDMALAGGVALSRQQGYIAQQGSILSASGHCRAFDASADGTVSGNGIGLVVLKRLEDAINDGDTIDTVIKGSAINNDGGNKISFTAPQVDTQAEVIQAAQQMAEVAPESISYIEAHGTGTSLGDPIEIAALTKAFTHGCKTLNTDDQTPENTGYCALGSIKTNIGHLDTAAGIAGLIKTVLCLKHRQLPPSLHYQTPNPQIDFDNSPFTVNQQLTAWHAPQILRAGVSSFGIGGTNAHVVLEEAPQTEQTEKTTADLQLLVLSAKSASALKAQAQRLAEHLPEQTQTPLADIAYTLQCGRRALHYRQFVVSNTHNDAVNALQALPEPKSAGEQPALVFQFPGQGSQHPAMGKNLYDSQPVFRDALDNCLTHLDRIMDVDTRTLLFKESDDSIHQTQYTQPLLFAVEYALAQYWLSLGVTPDAMHGHSIGEYVAACIAKVFDLETALTLVVTRGRLMQQAERGAMLTVFKNAGDLVDYINEDIALAATNSPDMSVLAGSVEAIEQLQQKLKAARIFCKPVTTSHAFHSPMMRDAATQFEQQLQTVQLQAPTLPMISNLSGDWLTDEQACSPHYWAQHLLHTVRFSEGTTTLLNAFSERAICFLEIGPQQALTTLVSQQLPATAQAINSQAKADKDEYQALLHATGTLWQTGAPILWSELHQAPQRRVHLPTYPFERQRYWISASESTLAAPVADQQTTNDTIHNNIQLLPEQNQWTYRPQWQRQALTTRQWSTPERHRWLIFDDQSGLGEALFDAYERQGEEAQLITQGETFAQTGYRRFSVNGNSAESLKQLLTEVQSRDFIPSHILYLWPLQVNTQDQTQAVTLAMQFQELLKQLALIHEPIQLLLLSQQAYDVLGSESINPNHALLQGLCQVVNQESPLLACRQIDIDQLTPLSSLQIKQLTKNICREGHAQNPSAVIAYRGKHRWQQQINASPLADDALPNAGHTLKQGGNYVIMGDITAGLGSIWAERLSRDYQANVLLLANAQLTTQPLATETLQAWRDNGAQVNYLSIDTSDAAVIAEHVQQFKQQLGLNHDGDIHGVFFSTPMTNLQAAAPIALLSDTQWQYNLRSKLQPLAALANAFADYSPGFFCIQSSLSSVVGGLGLAAYSGANHVIDSFVAQQNILGDTPWFSINWDACNDINTETDSATEEDGAGWGSSNLNEFTLSGDEVWAITERVITRGHPGQTIVSRGNLQQRMAQWLSFEPRVSLETVGDTGRHARPDIDTPYVAPRNEVEQAVAEILQDLLGIEAVGVEDNFYDLGGHSLLAIQAIARLRETFPVDVEMRELLFESPTAQRIAAVIAEQLPDQEELDEMEALLKEVQEMDTA